MIPQGPITERKIKADGTGHDYLCDVVYRSDALLVVAYVMRRGGTLPGVGLPVEPGSVSYGYFWRDRPHNLYRMKRPDGTVICHRIDAVADVDWSTNLLTYRDLVLDWWLLPGAEPLIEDEDELEAAILAGQLSADDLTAVEVARTLVRDGWVEIIAEAEACERDNPAMEMAVMRAPGEAKRPI